MARLHQRLFQCVDGGTRAVFTSTSASAEALQTVLDMGMKKGATSAINQMDASSRSDPSRGNPQATSCRVGAEAVTMRCSLVRS